MQKQHKTGKQVFVLRVAVTITLIIVALVFGLGSYFGLSNSERLFAVRHFNSLSDTALLGIQDSYDRMRESLVTLSYIYSIHAPNETVWPYVTYPRFYEAVPHMVQSSDFDTLGYAPIVQPQVDADPSNQTDFEAFMDNYYATEPLIPEDWGVDIPGYGHGGIWADPDQRHDVTGQITWGNSSLGDVMTPITQVTLGGMVGPYMLGMNAHANAVFGLPMSRSAQCVVDNEKSSQSSSSILSNCVHHAVSSAVNGFVGTAACLPVILDNTSGDREVVGFVLGHYEWHHLLDRIIPEYVGDIDVVITEVSTDVNGMEHRFTFTHTIVDGEAVVVGEGDHHDSTYSKYGHHVVDHSRVHQTLDISFYPRSAFFEQYETDTPLLVCVGSICLILLCCAVFLVYDIAVSRQSMHQQVVLDTKRRYVRFISHEVRTPLNTVQLGLKLFEMELMKMKKRFVMLPAEEFRNEIQTCIDSWIDLTNDVLGNSEAAVDVLSDLLNYDKIETGTLRLEFSSVAIFKVVGDVFKAFGLQAQQKSINLTLKGAMWGDVEADGGSTEYRDHIQRMAVCGDATRICQVLRNLISNALKFTPERGEVTVCADWIENGLPSMSKATIDVPVEQTSSVTLLEQPRTGAIRISVMDSGAGLSADQLAEIGTEGVQFNANQLQAGQGSGLGLFISKGIVVQHGGTMQVTSDGLGKGATFTIELPLFALPESVILYNDDSSQTIHDSTIEPEDAVPHRILVIDDASSNRKLLMRILKNKGYECEEAQDGEKGVAKYQEMCARGSPPDAILCDYEMPVMIGPHAVRHIRELGCMCFIVGVTGNVMQSDIDYFKAHGADAVLAKPLNTDTFESLFQQFLQKSAVNSPRYLMKDKTKVQVSSGSSSHAQYKVLPFEEKEVTG